MENVLKSSRFIPLALLCVYFFFIQNEVFESTFKLGILVLILLLFLNIFVFVNNNTSTSKYSSVIVSILAFLFISILLILLIDLFKNWTIQPPFYE